MPLNQCFGPNRLLPGDVIGDDSPEHMKFALLHVVPPSPAQPGVLALARSKCQSNRMSGLVPGAEPGPWRELAAGVHVCLAEPAAVNVGLIVGSESALV